MGASVLKYQQWQMSKRDEQQSLLKIPKREMELNKTPDACFQTPAYDVADIQYSSLK